MKENTTYLRFTMKEDTTFFWKSVKYCAAGISALMLAGIVTLMFLARDTREDITGIVAPALLITFISGVVAVGAALAQWRQRKV